MAGTVSAETTYEGMPSNCQWNGVSRLAKVCAPRLGGKELHVNQQINKFNLFRYPHLFTIFLLLRLDMKGNVRVGDFGLAEDIYTSGYFRQDKSDAVKLPFKWMAPESLRDGLFSEKSDVVSRPMAVGISSWYRSSIVHVSIQWSFGVTCWEVFTAGRMPYPGVDAMDMLKILERGTRLEKPSNAACAPEK